jgi:hypothetical protein
VRALDRDRETDFCQELDVVLAVAEGDHLVELDPEQLRDEGDPRSLRRAEMAELEEVGERGRDEHSPLEDRFEVTPDLGEPLRFGDRDELRGRPSEPREEVADLRDRKALEVRVRP